MLSPLLPLPRTALPAAARRRDRLRPPLSLGSSFMLALIALRFIHPGKIRHVPDHVLVAAFAPVLAVSAVAYVAAEQMKLASGVRALLRLVTLGSRRRSGLQMTAVREAD